MKDPTMQEDNSYSGNDLIELFPSLATVFADAITNPALSDLRHLGEFDAHSLYKGALWAVCVLADHKQPPGTAMFDLIARVRFESAL